LPQHDGGKRRGDGIHYCLFLAAAGGAAAMRRPFYRGTLDARVKLSDMQRIGERN
jgi:hypothetical protein